MALLSKEPKFEFADVWTGSVLCNVKESTNISSLEINQIIAIVWTADLWIPIANDCIRLYAPLKECF